MTKTISGREFNQDVSKAKRLAEKGPVVITDRGDPAYVLMTHSEYQRLGQTQQKVSILDLIGDPDGEDIKFEPERFNGSLSRQFDLE